MEWNRPSAPRKAASIPGNANLFFPGLSIQGGVVAIIEILRRALPDGWTVDRPLKEGGQGAVVQGAVAGVPCAIKVFHQDAERERLNREVGFLKQCQCPNVVKVVDTCEIQTDDGGCFVVAYELHGGGDLRDLVTRADVIEEADLVTIGHHIGLAIDCLWGKRIVHRDIKPDNIVKSRRGEYVLVDIGFARHLDLPTLTAPGGSPGTRGYRSPEQHLGRKRLTSHSDIFSLSVTLYELAAKRHPWHGRKDVMYTTAPDRLRVYRSDLSPALCDLITDGMNLLAASRPAGLSSHFNVLKER
jgi:serine/threonine protein kinase